jgi:hypothetical protein
MVVMLSSLYYTSSSSAQMSHDEEVVRNTYAKVTFMSSIWPLTKTTIAGIDKPVDLVKFKEKSAQETPVFTLRDFQMGPIADIADQPWSTFVSSASGIPVLNSSWYSHGYTYDGVGARWGMPQLRWGSPGSPNPEVLKLANTMTVAKVIKADGHNWTSVPVNYTRYAAFTVDLLFEGKSTGPYKALFLFGTDASGKEATPAMLDPISGNALFGVVVEKTYPAGLLQTRMRELPQVADWIRANEMPASSCSTPHEVCCSHVRCGLSQTDVNHEPVAADPTRTFWRPAMRKCFVLLLAFFPQVLAAQDVVQPTCSIYKLHPNGRVDVLQ